MVAAEGVGEEAQVVEAVEVDTITMADMDTETVTVIDAVRHQEVVHRDGLPVESSAVSSAVYSV